jgi:GNAT superfamily N-acetyltransferase
MQFRFAIPEDAQRLAPLNAQLIRDEGHRNSMTEAQLAQRMTDWLTPREYEVVLFEEADTTAGYALFRRTPEHVYLRQFFVQPEFRRKGIGRAALAWLWKHAWHDASRLRIDVLVGNRQAQAFWQSAGFQPYCVTMEMDTPEATPEATPRP